MMTNQEIADKNCILRAVVGSTLHGLAIEGQDDTDLMGVCIEPPEHVIGLRRFDQHVHRTQPEGVRSGPGDLDLVVYSLRKWCRLALSGNPTILLLLFAPDEFIVHRQDPWAEELQALAPAFMGRHLAAPYIGYMTAQMDRLLGVRGQKRVKRPELEAAHGFDVKYAMQILRLGFQGREILSSGRLTLPMVYAEANICREVRRGVHDLNFVLTLAGELRNEIRGLSESGPLAHFSPDEEAVEEFLVRVYQEWWNIHREAPNNDQRNP